MKNAPDSGPNLYLPFVNEFESYTWQHALPIIVSILVGVMAIRRGRKSSERDQRYLGLSLSLIVLGSIVFGNLILISRGEYNIAEDLPLYMCRAVAWILPIAIWKKWYKVLGVFYFWIMAGTLQAIITPDLAEGFPDYFYFRYWSLHAGLMVTILYAVIVNRLKIGWKDFWRAIVAIQFYLVFVHLANVVLGSNYSYTMHKPPGASILDLMGEWPWYLLAGEGVMIFLFLIFLLPYLIINSSRQINEPALSTHGSKKI